MVMKTLSINYHHTTLTRPDLKINRFIREISHENNEHTRMKTADVLNFYGPD